MTTETPSKLPDQGTPSQKDRQISESARQFAHKANPDGLTLSSFAELISSMRFAISLLSLIAVASIIGTVLKQNEPMPNYVNQFGPFWFEVFRTLGLYSVYSSWWFLLIMAFLVASTSLCLIRNTPKMLNDMRSWRDNVREQSLANFAHKVTWESALPRSALAAQLKQQLMQRGYKIKLTEKDNATLIAAKRGAANKLGYIFAHGAIVIILIGGLLDSDLTIRFQQWFMGKVPFEGNGIISQIDKKHRLSLSNPTFRGNTMIPEGQVSDSAIIQQANGVFIQDLPFSLRLKKFIIEFYSTGMPKLFASEVEVQDHATGKTFPATIKVNEPLIYQGISVYQSSFEDGGSKLQLTAYPMSGDKNNSFAVKGEVGDVTPLKGDAGYTIEWTGFRPFNVENMQEEDGKLDARAVKQQKRLDQQFISSIEQHSGSAAKGKNTKDLKNVGASVQYKLRDKNGQAREFSNYMQSVKMDGAWVFLAGVRDSPSEPFRFLRIPADDNDTVSEWMRLRAALMNPELRRMAAERYARSAFPDAVAGSELHAQLRASSEKSLAIFAGDEKNAAGYSAVSQFLEKIPANEQEKAAEVFIRILNGSLWELWQVARAQAGMPDMAMTEKHAQFLQRAASALSDAFFYNAPVYLQLNAYDEVKASVFQVTRSPGKNLVYVGCLLLVLGIFSMLYIRERRVWVWLKDQPSNTGSVNVLAMSTQRKTIDFENEFVQLKADLLKTVG